MRARDAGNQMYCKVPSRAKRKLVDEDVMVIVRRD